MPFRPPSHKHRRRATAPNISTILPHPPAPPSHL
jgi:hypothetical protein